MKYNFKIKGLDCANCAAQLEREIAKIKGIESAVINFMTEKMILEFDENNFDEIMKNLKKTIKKEEPDVTIEQI